MSEIKKLSIKILTLIHDIFLLGYKMVRQLALPTKKRKGNILLSIFIFFLGIVERLNHFEHGFFSMAALLQQKYVKQSVFIIAGILFLLSSFEWSGEHGSAVTETGRNTEQLPTPATKRITVDKHDRIICYSKQTSLIEEYPALQSNLHNSIISTSSVKKYLLIHSFRI